MEIDTSQIIKNSDQMFTALQQSQEKDNSMNNKVIKSVIEEKVAPESKNLELMGLGGRIDLTV